MHASWFSFINGTDKEAGLKELEAKIFKQGHDIMDLSDKLKQMHELNEVHKMKHERILLQRNKDLCVAQSQILFQTKANFKFVQMKKEAEQELEKVAKEKQELQEKLDAMEEQLKSSVRAGKYVTDQLSVAQRELDVLRGQARRVGFDFEVLTYRQAGPAQAFATLLRDIHTKMEAAQAMVMWMEDEWFTKRMDAVDQALDTLITTLDKVPKQPRQIIISDKVLAVQKEVLQQVKQQRDDKQKQLDDLQKQLDKAVADVSWDLVFSV